MGQARVGNIPAVGTLSAAWDGVGPMPAGGENQTDPRVVWLAISNLATVGVQVAGSFVGDLIPEVAIGRTNTVWMEIAGEVAGTGAPLDDIVAPGLYRFDVAGYSEFRMRCAEYTSGAASVVLLGATARSNFNGAVVAALNTLNATLENFIMSYQQATSKNAAKTVTAAYTASVNDSQIACNTSSGTFAVTLPASGVAGNSIGVLWTVGSVAPTVAFASGASLNAGETVVFGSMPSNNQIEFEWDGTSTYTIK